MKKKQPDFHILLLRRGFFYPLYPYDHHSVHNWHLPFGTKTILTSDLENQYVQFFSYLREIYKGNHSIFYTFSKTFGGEMLSLYAYYLMSPLNIILLFSEPNGSHRQLNF